MLTTILSSSGDAAQSQTAAEIVHARADSSKENMGLTAWKNAPKGLIRKADTIIAKNYLSQEEITSLNTIVVMYLDFAERQAQKRQPMHMADWIQKLDGFLQFNGENILTHAGKISHELAIEHSEKEFEKYETQRRKIEASEPKSDFDQIAKHIVDKIDK